MSQLLRRALCCVVFVGLAAGALATTAAADDIDVEGGNLFGVYVHAGTFMQDGILIEETTYTIVHHIQFGPSSFHREIIPEAFPAADFAPPEGVYPDDYFPTGTEFFLLGGMTGYEGAENHLLMSVANRDERLEGGTSLWTLHEALVAGSMALGAEPIMEMDALAFWTLINGDDESTALDLANSFFDINAGFGTGPIVHLERDGGGGEEPTYNFVQGSEDLFGFSDKFLIGQLNNGPLELTFTNIQNNTFTPVPEPATLALVFGGLVVGGAVRRRKRRAA